ncbi:MAG: hypothetical protein J7623_19780 [Chitinophaga sp.]|uniref:hypothetical protein n=1 Tax=Chitinophaga sp. TaxID=1869181 RepID=UPI001B127BFA|nr:hypothetical protein [Chitinophaga sp.]MBO9730890.1 hypothetical protein [Chitinophaga sp.]
MSNIVSRKIPCISVAVDAIKYVAAFFIAVITISLSNAQQHRINLKQKIVVPASALRFDSLLSIVGRQTGARFSLNTSKFPPSRLIHLGKKVMPVGELLTTIQNDAGIYYTVLGGHIIFIDNPPHIPHPAPAKKAAPAKAPSEKRPTEKLADHKLSATKPPPIQVWKDLQPLPVIYIIDTLAAHPTDTMYLVRQHPDSLRKTDSVLVKQSNALLQTDSVFVKQYPAAQKTDSVFAVQYHAGKTIDSVRFVQYHQAIQNGSLSGAGTNRYIPRISFPSWQFRPSIQLTWGRSGTDSVRHTPFTIALRDSSNKQQPDKINETVARPVATKTNVQQQETTTAQTSPNTSTQQQKSNTAVPQQTAANTNTKPPIIKQHSGGSDRTSWVKSTWQNIFDNPYQRPARQGTGGRTAQGPFSFLLNLGVSADEVYYANPTIQMGFPFLYGIVQGSTNFKLAQLRFGAGVSARISEDWRLHLQATTGSAQEQQFNIDSNRMLIPGTMESRLTKISLLGEKQLGDHFRLQAGLVWNSQQLQYSVPGKTVNQTQMAYKELNIIHAPYTLINSVSGERNNKAWIGIQVGIFYNINFNKRE